MGIKHTRYCIVAAFTLTLASCGVAPIVEPGNVVKIKDISLSSGQRWNQFGDSRMRLWTIDGSMLNDLRIFVDIKPGEHIFLAPKGRAERRGEGLLFRADMSELEVQELFVDALKRYDAVNVSADGLRPAKLGNRAGFRFELNFESGSGLSLGNRGGLKYKAMVLAETQGSTLSFLYFDAPAEFYFDRDKAAVEQIFATASAP